MLWPRPARWSHCSEPLPRTDLSSTTLKSSGEGADRGKPGLIGTPVRVSMTTAPSRRDSTEFPTVAIPSDADLAAQLKEHRATAQRAVRSVIGSSAEEEDLVQEVLTRLVIRLRQPGEINVGAWTWRVAHHLAVDHLRRSAGDADGGRLAGSGGRRRSRRPCDRFGAGGGHQSGIGQPARPSA